MSVDSAPSLPRQFVRRAARGTARLEIQPEDADQVRLAFPEAHANLDVVDVSEGGLGMQSAVFLPRNLRLSLHLTIPEMATGLERKLTVPVVVRRCTLLDHKPTYSIGVQFVDRNGPAEQTLMQLASVAPVAPKRPLQGAPA